MKVTLSISCILAAFLATSIVYMSLCCYNQPGGHFKQYYIIHQPAAAAVYILYSQHAPGHWIQYSRVRYMYLRKILQSIIKLVIKVYMWQYKYRAASLQPASQPIGTFFYIYARIGYSK